MNIQELREKVLIQPDHGSRQALKLIEEVAAVEEALKAHLPLFTDDNAMCRWLNSQVRHLHRGRNRQTILSELRDRIKEAEARRRWRSKINNVLRSRCQPLRNLSSHSLETLKAIYRDL